jgi:hypothetical protein
METKKISIEESNLGLFESKSMILKLIDDQINNYKIKFLADWERDHTTSAQSNELKIQALESKKKEIQEILSNFKSSSALVDFNISIDMTVRSTAKNSMAS